MVLGENAAKIRITRNYSVSIVSDVIRLHDGRSLITGDYIKEKYDSATEVRVSRRGRLQLRDPRFTLPTASDLVYLDDSPNYCVRDLSVGSLGKSLISFGLELRFATEWMGPQ